MKYLIIGAGPSGLAMARSMRLANISYEQAEANNDIGGNWLNGVYATVYTDACKDVMQFPELPMPADYPDFLSQKNMLDYLNQYCTHYNLRENILFNKKVIKAEPTSDGLWSVTFGDQTSNIYKGIIVCNGHHWDMKFAELNGNFGGEFIHSKEYKHPSQLAGKRVLVIGSGNSAADIACEAARVGAQSVMSMRDSPWIFPKSFMGVPLGRVKLRKSPQFLQPLLVKWLIKLTFGKHEYYNLPTPKHKPFEKHPTVSEELPYYLKHGRISVKPEIISSSGNTVLFSDNTSMEFDLIISATGFHLSFPFLSNDLVRVNGKNLQCVGYCVYPDVKGLFFLGWPQVRGGIGSLASAFSEVIADLIRVEEETGEPAGKYLMKSGNKIGTSHLYGSNEVFAWIKKYQKLKRRNRLLS